MARPNQKKSSQKKKNRLARPVARHSLCSFGERVLDVVKNIPKGKTLSYREVARLALSPRAARAVGNILNRNYNKKIPCHRVVRSDGKLGGYNRGIRRKLALLCSEGAL